MNIFVTLHISDCFFTQKQEFILFLEYITISYLNFLKFLWNENLNSYGQQFHQYQQNEQ